MSEESRQDSEAAEVPEDTGPRGGERLRAAREEQQISILEIAKELHLDEANVRALEDNQFESLGAPVFAKGHLRKYASLVGIDERDVLADYYELTRSAGVPPVVGKRRQPGSELSPGPWIVVILVLVVAAFAYWWFTTGRDLSPGSALAPAPADPAQELPSETPVTLPDAAEPAESIPAQAAMPEPGPMPATDTDTAEPEGVAVPEESDAPLPGTSPPVGPDVVAVSLAFTEDCWTEISDSTGERLFFGMGRAGDSVTVSGLPPLSVLLGSADGVSVTVDGQDYPIRDSDRRGRTARLTLP